MTGTQGAQGLRGEVSNTGAQGAQGTTGSQGHTGSQGIPGSATNTGAQGAQGTTGSQGHTGAQGLPGFATNTGAQGAQGLQGLSNVIYTDSWFQTNFIDAPPVIAFDNITSTTTNIFIPWTYPSQMPIGLLNAWIPVINSITSILSYDVSGPSLRTAILFSNTTTSYIDYHNGSSFITGIVLSKQSGSNGIQTLTFPGESLPRSAYVYYNTELAGIIPSSNNTLTTWYANGNPNSNPAIVELVLFVTCGPPSAPRSLSIGSITASTATVSYLAPLSNDITDPATLLTISDYTVSYSSSGSTIRYGGPIADSAHNVTRTGLSYGVTSLYPDSTYSFSVSATNSGNATGDPATTTATTSNLLPSALLSGSLSFPTRYYSHGTIKRIATGSTVTRLVNNSTSEWVSSAFIAPIHLVANRGSPLINIMNLNVSLSNNGITTGPNINFDGFPALLPSAQTLSDLTLTPVSVYDYYAGTTPSTGFYLNSSNTLTLGSTVFSPSQYDYIVSVTQCNSSATFTFQYDSPMSSPPVITSISVKMNSNYSSWVCGVRVISGTPAYNVTTVMSNMGNYYYSSPLLSYTSGPVAISPSSESNLTNITTGLTSGTFANSIKCTNSNILSSSLSSIYTNSVTLSGIANNIYAASLSLAASPITTLIDGPSVALVYSTLPQTLPSLTAGVSRVGFRVYSGFAGVANVPPFNEAGTPYANTAYDNTANISSLEEVQIANGKFTTPSGQAFAYSNYTACVYDDTNTNVADYSTIPSLGYRYATFAWRITPASPTVYGTLSFTLSNTSAITLTNTLAYAGSTPILLYYRIEDITSSAPTNASKLSSAWINGNSTTGTQVTSGNYFLPDTYTSTPNWGLNSVTVNGATTTFNVKIQPLNITSGMEIRLYCRIGLPMAERFTFSTVSARLS